MRKPDFDSLIKKTKPYDRFTVQLQDLNPRVMAANLLSDDPTMRAPLLKAWRRDRGLLMSYTKGPNPLPDRPWAYWWFDVDHAEHRTTVARAAAVADGLMTAEESDMLARFWAQHDTILEARANPKPPPPPVAGTGDDDLLLDED